MTIQMAFNSELQQPPDLVFFFRLGFHHTFCGAVQPPSENHLWEDFLNASPETHRPFPHRLAALVLFLFRKNLLWYFYKKTKNTMNLNLP